MLGTVGLSADLAAKDPHGRRQADAGSQADPYGTSPCTSLSDPTRCADATCILDVMPFPTVTRWPTLRAPQSFGSDDIDTAAGRISGAGGTVLVSKMSVPGGEILVAQYPQGAILGLFAGRFDD